MPNPDTYGKLLSVIRTGRFERRRLAKGSTLTQPAGATDSLMQFVLDGVVATYVQSGAGPAVLFAAQGTGGWQLPDELPGAGAPVVRYVALTNATVAQLRQSEFTRLLQSDPAFVAEAVRFRYQAHCELLRRVSDLCSRSSGYRIAAAVTYLADRMGTPAVHGRGTEISVSQDVIAAAANVRRQTANSYLRELARAGIVELTRGTIRLRDARALRRTVHGGPPA